MTNIPVFDSSSIEFPATFSAKSTRSLEPHALVAWNKPLSRGSRNTLWSAGADRPCSQASASRGVASPDQEVGSTLPASPKSSKNTQVTFPKWAETSSDRRTKAILSSLESSRARHQSEKNQDGSAADVGTSHHGTPRTVDFCEEVVNDKVITYPKFVVVSEKQSAKKLDGKSIKFDDSQNDGDNSAKRGHSYGRSRSNERLRRDVNARRSFKNYKALKPQVYDQSTFNNLGKSRGQSMESLLRKSYTPDNELLTNFFPEDTQDFLQAKSIGTNQYSKLLAKTRNESPGFQYPGPPPTPASALLMSFGIDPENNDMLEEELQNEIFLGNEHRKSLRDKVKSREITTANIKREGGDPGVSHTTHRLLESKIVKQNFAFPDISPEMQRKSIVKNLQKANKEAVVHALQRSLSPQASKSLRNGMASLYISAERLHNLEDSQDDGSREYLVTPQNVNTHKVQGQENGPISREHSFVGNNQVSKCNTFLQNKDKFSKLVSLGLPKVTLDINKEHFSKENLHKKSLMLREKFEIKDLRTEHLEMMRRSNNTPQLTKSIDVSKTDDSLTKPHISRVTLAIDIQKEKANSGLRKTKIKAQNIENKTDALSTVAQANNNNFPTRDSNTSKLLFQPPPTAASDHSEHKKWKGKTLTKSHPDSALLIHDNELTDSGLFKFRQPPNTPENGGRPKSMSRLNAATPGHESQVSDLSHIKFQPPPNTPNHEQNGRPSTTGFHSAKKKAKPPVIKTQIALRVSHVRSSVNKHTVIHL